MVFICSCEVINAGSQVLVCWFHFLPIVDGVVQDSAFFKGFCQDADVGSVRDRFTS
jgi:hypothetical protein